MENRAVQARQVAMRLGQKIGFSDRVALEQADAIARVLGGVSQAIRAAMPRHARRRGKANFQVVGDDQGLHGHWDDGPNLELLPLIRGETQLVSHWNPDDAARFSQSLGEVLLQGAEILPGFIVTRHDGPNVQLTWRRPVAGE